MMKLTIYLKPDLDDGAIGPSTSEHTTTSERELSLVSASFSLVLNDLRTCFGVAHTSHTLFDFILVSLILPSLTIAFTVSYDA